MSHGGVALSERRGVDCRYPRWHTTNTSEELPPMPTDSVTVEQPKHPLHALTTFELSDYRRQLESAIAFFDRKDPVPPARDRLQASLDAVLAEQEARRKIAHAG
jgi:hypothetical protein